MLIDSWSELTGGGLSFSDVLELFAVSIPKQSTYFISFFLVQTFTGMPMLLLDIGPLVVRHIALFSPAFYDHNKYEISLCQ